jgi:hypothetical protein
MFNDFPEGFAFLALPVYLLCMEFLKNNMGNIVAGLIVSAALIFLAARLILIIRKGKTGCGCGCGSCPKDGERA